MQNPPRQILVHLDGTPRAAVRLAAARRLAGRLECALAAHYAVRPAYVDLPYTGGLTAEAAASMLALDRERRQHARTVYQREMANDGPAVAWSETVELGAPGDFARQALFADLVVLGQRDPDDRDAVGLPGDFVASVLIDSGRPALVVPFAGNFPDRIDVVAIAWSETREAARAVSAAMPLLQRARLVHVFSWDAPLAAARGERGLNLAGYLRLHGVSAEFHPQGRAPAALGEHLLSRACDVAADLLVMGCYGHSRAREWMLGGTSRTVLASMTLPVLLAH